MGVWVRPRVLMAAAWGLALAAMACAGAAPAVPAPATGAVAPAAASQAAAPQAVMAQATSSAPPTPRALEKVSYTLPARGTDYLYTAVAAKRGFFAEEGLEATWEQALATVGIPAVQSGQFDFTTAVGSAQSVIVQGAPLKIVMAAQEYPGYGFFARPGISSVQELKGKQLGITTVGSAAHIIANVVLEKHGLDPDQDVSWVQLRQVPNLWQALQMGLVDASMVGTADVHRPGKLGYTNLRIFQDPSARNVSAGLTATDGMLRDRPDTVKRTIRALIKGVQFMKAHKAETVPIMVEFIDLPAEDAAELYDLAMDTFSPQGFVGDDVLRQSIDVLAAAMELREPPAVAQVFDLRLAREAHAELQREGWRP
jgi:NitT/TauT family transport system substrate-binding protein